MVSQHEIDDAIAALRRGELVAFPTETVYGLGADASNPDAVRRIFAAKGRPADHPVIVHLHDAEAMHDWTENVPELARRLAAAFWPGPLTMIVQRAPHVNDVVTGGQDTVGLRVPDHPVAQALLRAFGGGLAAPSANRFGRISPTRAEHVRAELGDRVAMVLDGGPARVGLESSIVDLSGPEPRLLRPGHISRSQLEAALGVPLRDPQGLTPRAPGTLASHYAPRTPVRLVAGSELLELLRSAIGEGTRVAVLARRPAPPELDVVAWIEAPTDAAGFGAALYADLRALDAIGADLIAVESVPADEAWHAVADRLRRAAHR